MTESNIKAFLCVADLSDINGRRESQGSLSSGASLDLGTSGSGKNEVSLGKAFTNPSWKLPVPPRFHDNELCGNGPAPTAGHRGSDECTLCGDCGWSLMRSFVSSSADLVIDQEIDRRSVVRQSVLRNEI